MKHAIAMVCFVLTMASAFAAPARPLYEPPPPPQPPSVVDIRGTEWHGPEAADGYLAFHADGTLSYARGQNRGNASWKMEGNTIYFEINNGYREFRGTLQGGAIVGDSWNKAGKRWRTVLQRVGPVK